MIFQRHKKASFRIVLILALMMGIYGVIPARASAERSVAGISQEPECEAGSGWMWTDGPAEPAVAGQVQRELGQRGIQATVKARSYGERDSCGNYHSQGIDFTITLKEARYNPSGLA